MGGAVGLPSGGRNLLVGFLAGVWAVAVFHQLAVFVLGVVGLADGPVYSFRPTTPLGVPQVISQMFWGGMWGIVFAATADRWPQRWPVALIGCVFGIVGPSLFGWLVVAPIRGQPIMAGGNPQRLLASVLINGSFGLGLALGFDWLRRSALRHHRGAENSAP